jgi:hypothetical protein
LPNCSTHPTIPFLTFDSKWHDNNELPVSIAERNEQTLPSFIEVPGEGGFCNRDLLFHTVFNFKGYYISNLVGKPRTEEKVSPDEPGWR